MKTSTVNTKIRRWQRAILPVICLLFTASYLPLAVSESNSELSAVDEDLFAAMRKEDPAAASDALARGANINAISPKGHQTPLMQSVLHGRETMVRWCLANGADITIAEKDGYTPMHGAAFQGHAVIADVLLAHGVPLRDIHKDGYEPASKFMTKIISVFYPRIMFLWWIRAIFCDEPSTLEQVPMGILLNKSSDHSFSTRIVLFMFVTCASSDLLGIGG